MRRICPGRGDVCILSVAFELADDYMGSIVLIDFEQEMGKEKGLLSVITPTLSCRALNKIQIQVAVHQLFQFIRFRCAGVEDFFHELEIDSVNRRFLSIPLNNEKRRAINAVPARQLHTR